MSKMYDCEEKAPPMLFYPKIVEVKEGRFIRQGNCVSFLNIDAFLKIGSSHIKSRINFRFPNFQRSLLTFFRVLWNKAEEGIMY